MRSKFLLAGLAAVLTTVSLRASPLPEPDEHELPPVEGMRRGWTVETGSREAVRLFWRVRYRASTPTAFWRGNLANCEPGETLAEHRAAMLARINWYRAMAGVPGDMTEDPAATRKAQAAALITAANSRISHDVTPDWACFSADAQEGAHLSSIALVVNGTEAIDSFMRDAGALNHGTNHRRWLLFPNTMFMGLGDVRTADPQRTASAFTAFDGLYNGNRPALKREFVAWPPPGWVPYQVVFPRWSFAFPGADLTAATVTMTRAGQPVEVAVEPYDDGAGEPTLVWRADGQAHDAIWPRPAADTVYQVAVDNVKVAGETRRFEYEVKVFDPDGPAPDKREATINGPARATGAEGAGYGVLAQPGATGYQWRALRTEPWTLDEGAENGYGAFSYSGANNYPVLDRQAAASGKQSFRLAHNGIGDETLLLAEQVALGQKPALLFRGRRGVAGLDEVARVEVLVEGRDAWETVYLQRSDGKTASAEPAFFERRVDLSPYAERLVRLRFRYQFAGGDFYSPDDPRIGWYLDDIRLDDVHRLVETGEPQRVTLGRFDFRPARPGDWRLQARPTVYRAAGDWGPLWAVKVQ